MKIFLYSSSVYSCHLFLTSSASASSMKTYKTFRINTPKRCPFHYWGLECKSRNSRNTWSNKQIWPWNIEWSRAKANRVLSRKYTGHSKHPLPATWDDSTREHHYVAVRDGEALYSQQKQDQEQTGSNHELLIPKFRLKLKKVGKTTRPFRYDLNQIPYDYTV